MPEKIVVNQKALAHLSRGLYRSPASALRELVSNAWDAHASEVRIDTSAPEFTQITVQDNGVGFTKDEFVRLMKGGIGNSEKRTPRNPSRLHGRPLIGRLGIGMLGIAQICPGFTITSKPKSGRGFRARVRLYDLIRPKLDREDPSVVIKGEDEGLISEVDVGEYVLEDFDPKSSDYGTVVLADDVHPTFIHSFRETYQQPPMQWGNFIRKSGRHHTLQELGDYWKFVWELSATCPVRYIDSRAVPEGVIRVDQTRLESFDFKVFVDNIEIRKPVRLVGNKNGYTTIAIGPEEHRVFGKTVRFHGYVAVQEGLQLKPDELRGFLVRISEVGIGQYDRSLLNYRYNEGPRGRWITGEFYVEQGVEDALNIDRDSFNQFHPEYRIVQRRVHEILQKKVLPKVYHQIDVRSEKKERVKAREKKRALSQVLAGESERDVKIVAAKPQSPSSADRALSSSSIVVRGNQMRVSLPHSDLLRQVKAKHRDLFGAVMAVFDLSSANRDPKNRRRVFIEKLIQLLSRW